MRGHSCVLLYEKWPSYASPYANDWFNYLLLDRGTGVCKSAPPPTVIHNKNNNNSYFIFAICVWLVPCFIFRLSVFAYDITFFFPPLSLVSLFVAFSLFSLLFFLQDGYFLLFSPFWPFALEYTLTLHELSYRINISKMLGFILFDIYIYMSTTHPPPQPALTTDLNTHTHTHILYPISRLI